MGEASERMIRLSEVMIDLAKIIEQCAHPGWDGESAVPIDAAYCALAGRVLVSWTQRVMDGDPAIPPPYESPVVAGVQPRPDGSLNLTMKTPDGSVTRRWSSFHEQYADQRVGYMTPFRFAENQCNTLEQSVKDGLWDAAGPTKALDEGEERAQMIDRGIVNPAPVDKVEPLPRDTIAIPRGARPVPRPDPHKTDEPLAAPVEVMLYVGQHERYWEPGGLVWRFIEARQAARQHRKRIIISMYDVQLVRTENGFDIDDGTKAAVDRYRELLGDWGASPVFMVKMLTKQVVGDGTGRAGTQPDWVGPFKLIRDREGNAQVGLPFDARFFRLTTTQRMWALAEYLGLGAGEVPIVLDAERYVKPAGVDVPSGYHDGCAYDDLQLAGVEHIFEEIGGTGYPFGGTPLVRATPHAIYDAMARGLYAGGNGLELLQLTHNAADPNYDPTWEALAYAAEAGVRCDVSAGLWIEDMGDVSRMRNWLNGLIRRAIAHSSQRENAQGRMVSMWIGGNGLNRGDEVTDAALQSLAIYGG